MGISSQVVKERLSRKNRWRITAQEESQGSFEVVKGSRTSVLYRETGTEVVVHRHVLRLELQGLQQGSLRFRGDPQFECRSAQIGPGDGVLLVEPNGLAKAGSCLGEAILGGKLGTFLQASRCFQDSRLDLGQVAFSLVRL